MMKIDVNAVADIINSVASSEIMPRYKKLQDGDIQMKGVNDPVTIADKEAERCLTEKLRRLLPGSVVLGEESFAADKSIMTRLDADKPVWIIDPIDGTRNFVAGKPEFAVMVALVTQKQAIASWIHDPNSGDTIMAEKGGGVWLRGQKLHLAAADATVTAVGIVGARVKKLINDPTLIPQSSDQGTIEIGSCAGFDYPRLFSGPINFASATSSRAQFLFYRHTNAWDHVPGLFLHHEAGGYSATWAGKPYDMADQRCGLLIAPSETAWRKLDEFFHPLISHAFRVDP